MVTNPRPATQFEFLGSKAHTHMAAVGVGRGVGETLLTWELISAQPQSCFLAAKA